MPLAVLARNRNQAPKAAIITILFSGYYLLRRIVPRILRINFYANAEESSSVAALGRFFAYSVGLLS